MKKILSTNKAQIAFVVLTIALTVTACMLSFNAGVRWSVSHGALSLLLKDENFEKRLRQELGRQLRANEREKWENSVVCRTDTVKVYVTDDNSTVKGWNDLTVEQKRQITLKKQMTMTQEERQREAREWLRKGAMEIRKAKGQ